MNVLGIETSCDETAAAVVTENGKVLSDVVATQIATHQPYGGVVPELASRAHLRAIMPVIERALDQIPGGLSNVHGIAVTQGPGLVGSLLVGLQTAKTLAWSRNLPLVGVNHLEGHLLAGFLRRNENDTPPKLPFIALLASGGHTALYRVDGFRAFRLLGQTRDDAAGEAFDKVAKVLGLGYPGGPAIDKRAALGQPNIRGLPSPMAHSGLEFSFSGLKTAVSQWVRTHGRPETDPDLNDFCASFQTIVVTLLVRKALQACEQENVHHLVLTGGVAANRGLREAATQACAERGMGLSIPPIASCTDNAAMIAFAGAQSLLEGKHEGWGLRAYSRDPERKRGKFA